MRKGAGVGKGKATKPYNPLEKRRLAESIVRELLARPSEGLPPAEPFLGAGVYVMYYVGGFDLYRPLGALNAGGLTYPIYVGQAIGPGGRKGGFAEGTREPVLCTRLGQHAASIRQAENLDPADFRCRYLVVDDIWIGLAEGLLIEAYRPVWNVVVDGFGNHDPGKGRHQGKRPNWDTLHPGRPWAERLQPSTMPLVEIERKVATYLQSLPRG